MHAFRNLNDSNTQDDLPLTKNRHGQPHILMIQTYSAYHKENFPCMKNQFWKVD